MLKPGEDAYGRIVFDHLHGKATTELVEREDGFISTSGGAASYFAPFRRWPPTERQAARLARGRVLDVGCGAGRLALRLQERGHDAVGIDISPLAIRTSKLRGVRRAHVLSVTGVGSRLGTFDTIAMFGNNFGLFASLTRARWLLRRFRGVTNDGARLLATSRDIHATDEPEHRAYHRQNRKRGRMPGQIRLRVRYRSYCTPWFDYLMVSPDEMRRVVEGTGWCIERIFRDASPNYVALLARDD